MKKLLSTLFVAGIATAAFANNDVKSVEIRQTETAKVAVAFHAVPQGTVIVKITDDQDRLILRDRITKTEAFAKKYDLNALPEGIYYLVAESEYKISKYKISIVGAVANLSEIAIENELKPIFIEQDGLVKLSFLNLNEAPTYIKIYNQANDLVYDSGKLVNQSFAKTFDIYNLQNEEYTFVVTVSDKTFSKTFSKRL